MRHRQVVLLGRGGLDDDAQALHAVYGDPVAAGQEHCSSGESFREEKNNVAADICFCVVLLFAPSCHTVKSIIRVDRLA